jgi:hypothetical protein
MRVFAMILSAVLLAAEAQAQEKAQQPDSGPCTYSIGGRPYEVPVGVKICFRSPFPYGDQYSLQQCFPPLDEIALVRRGDPRCERYEDRQ